MAVKSSRLWLYSQVAPHIPYRCNLIRIALLRWAGCEIGEDVIVHPLAHFSGQGSIIVGAGSYIGPFNHLHSASMSVLEIGKRVHIVASNMIWAGTASRLVIGDGTKVSHFVSLKTSTHEINLIDSAECIAGEERFQDILIGNGCWLCASSVVIPGVAVGDHTIVAAGSVVIRSCASRSLLAGCPAVCKKRYDKASNGTSI